ncbi:uncharacterized protein FIBRA_04675 [Fibroporia radiculosa]|uniref:Cytochrome c oxidase assembly protein n=1 Tax=Fibroporia radiculosa TaxID=599839 RepID=J4HWN5_9APHY|nr:uncharacterized protein FIBRA_04675 [Fibroporia radiculosa]CCM02572.1 predicted protein [Fibroporia radiculosa]
MSRVAKLSLAAAILTTTAVIWGVHFQQNKERETMYQGVVRDEARRREKMRQREEELQDSLRKREIYERVQNVPDASSGVDHLDKGG